MKPHSHPHQQHRLLCLSIAALLLASCKISTEIDIRNGTSTPATPLKTPTELEPTISLPFTEIPQGPPSPTGVEFPSSCDQGSGENVTASPNAHSYILYCSNEESGEKCRVVDVLQNEIHPLPDGLVALGWSPTGDRLLLVDENGPGVYIADTLGEDPVEVFSVESEQVENDWGWWLSEDEVIVAGRLRSEGGHFYWQYYRVNVESGSYVAFDLFEPLQIYDVATNGGFWIEGFPEIDLVYDDHNRIPLWDEGEVAYDVTPIISYLSIVPNNCGVVFMGCSGVRVEWEDSCWLYTAILHDQSISGVEPLYPLGDFASVHSIEVSPDSRYLAFVDYWSNLVVIDLSDAHIVYERELPFTLVTTPQIAWGPDSNEIAITILSQEEMGLFIQNLQMDTLSMIVSGGIGNLIEWRDLSR